MKELKDNLFGELLTGSDAENDENDYLRAVINIDDKVESWPLKSEQDEVVRKLDGKVDTVKGLGNVGESKTAECSAWLFEFHNTPYHTLDHLLHSLHHYISIPLHNHKLLFAAHQRSPHQGRSNNTAFFFWD